MAIEGEREYKLDNFTMLAPFAEGDLYHSVMKGAAGLGDPLERPLEAVERDVAEGHILPEFAEKAYAVADRDGARRRRLERARPFAEWWAEQRERVLAAGPDRAGRGRLRRVDEALAALGGRVPRLLGPARGLRLRRADPDPAGRPRDAAGQGHARPSRRPRSSPAPRSSGSSRRRWPASRSSAETLEALLDERLSRREVKEIQSGYKDPDRFDKWVALLQSRVDWDDPIVLPLGEGLNVVRRSSDGELVIRSDAGHDFCRFDATGRRTRRSSSATPTSCCSEIYPRMAHCDPDWMELREFYCPLSGRLLETEAVTPGYPVVHDFLPDIEGFYRGWLGREVP